MTANYNRVSHAHCWKQKQPPACGIPLDKHTQCCLCDLTTEKKCPYCQKTPCAGVFHGCLESHQSQGETKLVICPRAGCGMRYHCTDTAPPKNCCVCGTEIESQGESLISLKENSNHNMISDKTWAEESQGDDWEKEFDKHFDSKWGWSLPGTIAVEGTPDGIVSTFLPSSHEVKEYVKRFIAEKREQWFEKDWKEFKTRELPKEKELARMEGYEQAKKEYGKD